MPKCPPKDAKVGNGNTVSLSIAMTILCEEKWAETKTMKGGDSQALAGAHKTYFDKSKSVEGDFTTIDSFSDYLKNITKEYCVTENTNRVIIQKENTQVL